MGDPEVTKFMNINSFTDESQAVDMIEMLDKLSRENRAIRYSIIELESNEIIGSVVIIHLISKTPKQKLVTILVKLFGVRGMRQKPFSL